MKRVGKAEETEASNINFLSCFEKLLKALIGGDNKVVMARRQRN